MSQQESLKDTLLEELAQLEVFARLVRYPFARSQLLRIMASLMASQKMLAKRLSENYVSRYEVVAGHEEEELESSMDTVEDRSTEFSSLYTYDSESTNADSISDFNDEFSADIGSIVGLPHRRATQEELDAINDSGLEELSAVELQVIDLGLRLGSFLSEAGWMQESITVLACLNVRLKDLPTHKHWLQFRLDCLQR